MNKQALSAIALSFGLLGGTAVMAPIAEAQRVTPGGAVYCKVKVDSTIFNSPGAGAVGIATAGTELQAGPGTSDGYRPVWFKGAARWIHADNCQMPGGAG